MLQVTEATAKDLNALIKNRSVNIWTPYHSLLIDDPATKASWNVAEDLASIESFLEKITEESPSGVVPICEESIKDEYNENNIKGKSLFRSLINHTLESTPKGEGLGEKRTSVLADIWLAFKFGTPDDFDKLLASCLFDALDDIMVEFTPDGAMLAPTEIKEEDLVNHPNHYQGAVECIDLISVITEGLEGLEAYDTGTACKYLFRWKKKNTLPSLWIQDLEKAKWYIENLIKRIKSNVNYKQ